MGGVADKARVGATMNRTQQANLEYLIGVPIVCEVGPLDGCARVYMTWKERQAFMQRLRGETDYSLTQTSMSGAASPVRHYAVLRWAGLIVDMWEVDERAQPDVDAMAAALVRWRSGHGVLSVADAPDEVFALAPGETWKAEDVTPLPYRTPTILHRADARSLVAPVDGYVQLPERMVPWLRDALASTPDERIHGEWIGLDEAADLNWTRIEPVVYDEETASLILAHRDEVAAGKPRAHIEVTATRANLSGELGAWVEATLAGVPTDPPPVILDAPHFDSMRVKPIRAWPVDADSVRIEFVGVGDDE